MNAFRLMKEPNMFLSVANHADIVDADNTGLSLQVLVSKAQTHLHDLALIKPYQFNPRQSSFAKIIGYLFVVMVHVLMIYLMLFQQIKTAIIKPATPMVVSIIAPPAKKVIANPEIVPIIKPEKVIKRPVIKPKIVVKKMVPIAQPTQPVFEAKTEPITEVSETEEDIASPEMVAKPTPQAAPVEEKMALPKFGVAYLNNPAPNYPRLAKRMGEEGRVLLKVLVTVDGKAEAVSLEESSGFDRLDEAAIDAVKRWRFVPARKAGEALNAYVLVPIKFSLSD